MQDDEARDEGVCRTATLLVQESHHRQNEKTSGRNPLVPGLPTALAGPWRSLPERRSYALNGSICAQKCTEAITSFCHLDHESLLPCAIYHAFTTY